MPRPLQPALHFLNLSGGNSVIVDNTGFKIPNLAGSEVQDSVSDLTDNLSVLIEQLYFDNQIGEPVFARIGKSSLLRSVRTAFA
jgi:hypothetical protein